MITPELTEIITQRFKKGESREKIKASLMDEGYKEYDIDETIAHIRHEALKQLPLVEGVVKWWGAMDKKTAHFSPKKIMLILVLFAVFVLGGALYLNFVFDPLGNRAFLSNQKREGALIQFRDALDKHYSDFGTYPFNLEDLIPNYLSQIPQDKTGEKYYHYNVINNGYDYKLCVDLVGQAMKCTSTVGTQPIITATPKE